MKLKLVMIGLLMTSTVFASLNTNVSVTTDYVWRGQTQSSTAPAVQGTAEYSYDFITVGTWLSSLGGSNAGAEVDLYLSLNHSFSAKYAVSVMATNYTYTKDSNLNLGEYSISFSNPIINLMVAYTGEYGGTKSNSSTYYNLSKSFMIDKTNNVGLSLSAGLSTFDKETVVGSKDYVDYKIALTKEKGDMGYELFFSDTNRKAWDGTVETDTKDSVLGIALKYTL